MGGRLFYYFFVFLGVNIRGCYFYEHAAQSGPPDATAPPGVHHGRGGGPLFSGPGENERGFHGGAETGRDPTLCPPGAPRGDRCARVDAQQSHDDVPFHEQGGGPDHHG